MLTISVKILSKINRREREKRNPHKRMTGKSSSVLSEIPTAKENLK